MPKVKTHQGTTKRIKISRKGKMIARSTGQDHFNSRANGKKTINKRRDQVLSTHNTKFKTLIPYQ